MVNEKHWEKKEKKSVFNFFVSKNEKKNRQKCNGRLGGSTRGEAGGDRVQPLRGLRRRGQQQQPPSTQIQAHNQIKSAIKS